MRLLDDPLLLLFFIIFHLCIYFASTPYPITLACGTPDTNAPGLRVHAQLHWRVVDLYVAIGL
jgi:hypothetical protein